jgi:hypothetical protein
MFRSRMGQGLRAEIALVLVDARLRHIPTSRMDGAAGSLFYDWFLGRAVHRALRLTNSRSSPKKIGWR